MLKKLLTLPLIFLFIGCGGSDETDELSGVELEAAEAEFKAALLQDADYLAATVYNRDDLLSATIGFEECDVAETFAVINKWTCDLGLEPIEQGDCNEDEDGVRQPLLNELSEICEQGLDTMIPEDNGWASDVWYMLMNGKLPASNWCGPGDARAETKGVHNGVDGGCRRHDHGKNYNECNNGGDADTAAAGGQGECPNSGWWTAWQDLPKALCVVDADIVAASHSQSGNSTTKSAIQTVFSNNTGYPCRAVNASAWKWVATSCSSSSSSCGWRGWRTCTTTTCNMGWHLIYGNKNVDGNDKIQEHNRASGEQYYYEGCHGDSLTASNSCQ
jgi:hypothetical protein